MASIKFANTYDTAGLDVNKIPKVKDAIKAYVAKLNKLADELDASKNSEWNTVIKNAIKGTNSEAGAKSYISGICAECRDQISVLNSFVNALDKLEQKYKSNDKGGCTDIGIIEGGTYHVMKPVIYLYPEETTEVSVKLGNPDLLVSSYPKYNEGWNVTAHPNGDLYDAAGNYYYTLFWDAEDTTGIDLSEGFVVKGEDTAAFLREKLMYMGFNAKETNEFIIFWLERMENNKYNYIRFRQTEEVNEYMPMVLDKQPDTLLRVIMDYKALDEEIEVRPQELKSTERKGFVVTEWGGRNLK